MGKLNHKVHEGHKGNNFKTKPKESFFAFFVTFVVKNNLIAQSDEKTV